MRLNDQLDSLTTKLRAMVPAERLLVVDQFAEELVKSGLANRTLKAGDLAPAFELPDGDGMLWRSQDLLSSGPLSSSSIADAGALTATPNWPHCRKSINRLPKRAVRSS